MLGFVNLNHCVFVVQKLTLRRNEQMKLERFLKLHLFFLEMGVLWKFSELLGFFSLYGLQHDSKGEYFNTRIVKQHSNYNFYLPFQALRYFTLSAYHVNLKIFFHKFLGTRSIKMTMKAQVIFILNYYYFLIRFLPLTLFICNSFWCTVI